MRFYAVEKIGQKQSLTPEGFLLCLDVPIARTGQQMYGPEEVPVEVGPRGVVMIDREEKEVFRPEFIASFNGKPVVHEHPDRDVTPENWKRLTMGTVMNTRRGEGDLKDLLLADLIVCDPEIIDAVRAGKREVSCGYDAEYEEIEPGHGRQYQMVGNHVALVESGRCGPRCAIGDRKPSYFTGDSQMKPRMQRAMDAVRKAFKSRDEAGLEEALQEVDAAVPSEEETHVHLHQADSPPARGMTDEDINNRFDSIEGSIREMTDAIAGLKPKEAAEDADPNAAKVEVVSDEEKEEKALGDALEEEAPPAAAKDAVRKAKDSAYLGDSFQETVSLAEIIVPGIRVPAYDRAMKPKETLDAMCKLRRNALDLAYTQPAERGLIDDAMAGRTLKLADMSCRDVRVLFRSVGLAKKAANRHGTGDLRHVDGDRKAVGGVRTLKDLNAVNAKHYGPKQ